MPQILESLRITRVILVHALVHSVFDLIHLGWHRKKEVFFSFLIRYVEILLATEFMFSRGSFFLQC